MYGDISIRHYTRQLWPKTKMMKADAEDLPPPSYSYVPDKRPMEKLKDKCCTINPCVMKWIIFTILVLILSLSTALSATMLNSASATYIREEHEREIAETKEYFEKTYLNCSCQVSIFDTLASMKVTCDGKQMTVTSNTKGHMIQRNDILQECWWPNNTDLVFFGTPDDYIDQYAPNARKYSLSHTCPGSCSDWEYDPGHAGLKTWFALCIIGLGLLFFGVWTFYVFN